MLDHVSIGARDLTRARAFYDAALGALGGKSLASGDTYIGYGTDYPIFWVYTAKSPVPPDTGSGLHFCFKAGSRAAVDQFHREALAHAGKDNGAPGLRADYGTGYYAAFVVDPDGYRIEAYYNEA